MGINLGNLSQTPNQGGNPVATTTASTLAPAPLPVNGILNMEKAQTLDLTKKNPGLSKLKVGLGWDTASLGDSFDLDASAFLLGANGKCSDVSYICYFNNPNSHGVKSLGDNRTGMGEGDDETIVVDLAQVPSNVTKVKFAVTIFEALQKRQNFGMVQNAYIRLIDDVTGSELCRFVLTDDYSTSTAVIFAEVERQADGNWNFNTIGEGSVNDLNNLAGLFL